jgi:hypothetical protein
MKKGQNTTVFSVRISNEKMEQLKYMAESMDIGYSAMAKRIILSKLEQERKYLD